MWFIFGFITFISFSVYFGHKRFRASWKGTAATAEGIDYQYRLLRSKYGVTGFMLGIAGSPHFDFTLKREAWYDRLFKFMGLSVEHEVGREEFDHLVYIVSDDALLHKAMKHNAAITDLILGLFHTGADYHCRIREVRNNAGRLWVKFKAMKGFNEARLAELASVLTPHLKQLSDALSQMPVRSQQAGRDPFVIRAAIILAISTGLAINGAVHMTRLGFGNIPFILDVWALLENSLYIGLGLIAVLILAALFFLGRSARTHLVLIELVLIGSFGAIASTAAELRDINMDLDQGPTTDYQVKLLNKTLSRSKRSTRYYLHLEDWTGEDSRRKVKVSHSLYRSSSPGEYVIVSQKNGYLNYRWVESIRRKPG